VQRRLERLRERERLILERRFGLKGEPQSLETVGRELGRLTHERVRQLQVQALKQLETELADLAPVPTAAPRAAQAREAERVSAQGRPAVVAAGWSSCARCSSSTADWGSEG
jgi:hypothetical protein